MVSAILANPVQIARVLAYYILISGAPSEKVINQGTEPNLVRVNIITETRGAKDTVEINGKLLTDYSPTIIQSLSATGIVLDDRGHIMTFLGYRWIDIQDHRLRINISTGEGQRLKGKLVGIDQSNGVAVIRLLNGKLGKTPVCTKCEVKDGVTIKTPVIEGPAPSQYGEAQILSVGANQGITGEGNWTVAVNGPFPDVGQPILTMDHRVLGFVASQDPMDVRIIVYPIAQLLSSAEKILKAGGDIRTGWLGVFLIDAPPEAGSGIVIRRVEPDSPAQKAGLVPDDLLLKYNGRQILDARQFIQLVQSSPIGSKANLEIIRQGKPMDVTALVGTRKPPQSQGKLSFNLSGAFGSIFAGMPSEPELPSPHLLFGLDTAVLTPFLTDALQMPGQTGLLVTDVAKKMPADLAGIMVGDVIVAIDGQPIVDPLTFASFLQTHTWGSQSFFKILRKGTERTITVQIPD